MGSAGWYGPLLGQDTAVGGCSWGTGGEREGHPETQPSRAKGVQSKMRSKPLPRERERGVIVSWV